MHMHAYTYVCVCVHAYVYAYVINIQNIYRTYTKPSPQHALDFSWALDVRRPSVTSSEAVRGPGSDGSTSLNMFARSLGSPSENQRTHPIPVTLAGWL